MKKLIEVMLIVMVASCRPAGTPAPSGGADEGASGPTRSGEVRAGTQPGSDRYRQAGTGDAEPAPESTDRTIAVDVGNPTDVGPVPGGTGKLQLHLADAPIDGAQALVVRPRTLELIAEDGAVAAFDLGAGDVDLLQFQNGAKHALFAADVDAKRYTALRVNLAPDDPASLIDGDGNTAPVAASVLTGAIDLNVGEDAVLDVTMHVDLRKTLRDVNGTLQLLPQHHTFLSDSVGSLRGVGLEAALVKVACVYPADGLLGLNRRALERGLLDDLLPPPDGGLLDLLLPGSSECLDAAGSIVVDGTDFQINYLPPGSYAIRLYLTETLYLQLPMLHDVTAGLTSVVDLEALNAQLAVIGLLLGL